MTWHTITTPRRAYHEHNGQEMRRKILRQLDEGQAIALIRDAGTPLISDPGMPLVRAAREAGHEVFAIPGPSAPIAALSIAGLPTDQFSFYGFLPPKQAARQKALQKLAEQASIGSADSGENTMYTRLLEMIRHYDLDQDPIVREMLADLYINTKVAGYTSQRATDKMRAGQMPGPEMSIGKMALVNNQKKMNDLVAHILGAKLVVDTGEWGTYAWSQLLLGAPGMRIAGGSDEVMRNIVGERVLGLPKDVGIDSKSAFRDIKVGTQKD